jgi:putative transcriptional regulator
MGEERRMPSKKPPAVSNRIRELRFHQGQLTQQQLADEVGVTRQTIIALEANKYVPSLLLAFRIAANFGVGVEEVFHFNGKLG